MFLVYGYECGFVHESIFLFRFSQLIGHLFIIDRLPPALLYSIIVITVKQALGIHGLLAGYDAKPLGAGLGRDNKSLFNFVKILFHTCIL